MIFNITLDLLILTTMRMMIYGQPQPAAYELIKVLEKGTDKAFVWIDFNFIHSNLDNFQAIISTKDKRNKTRLKILSRN